MHAISDSYTFYIRGTFLYSPLVPNRINLRWYRVNYLVTLFNLNTKCLFIRLSELIWSKNAAAVESRVQFQQR